MPSAPTVPTPYPMPSAPTAPTPYPMPREPTALPQFSVPGMAVGTQPVGYWISQTPSYWYGR